MKKNPFAYLAGIFFITLVSIPSGYVSIPSTFFATPDFSLFFKCDVLGALKWSLLPAILTLFFTDFFDSLSTFVGVAHHSGLLDERGEPIHLKEGLIVDSLATLFAGVMGTSSGTTYIESAAGIDPLYLFHNHRFINRFYQPYPPLFNGRSKG